MKSIFSNDTFGCHSIFLAQIFCILSLHLLMNTAYVILQLEPSLGT